MGMESAAFTTVTRTDWPEQAVGRTIAGSRARVRERVGQRVLQGPMASAGVDSRMTQMNAGEATRSVGTQSGIDSQCP